MKQPKPKIPNWCNKYWGWQLLFPFSQRPQFVLINFTNLGILIISKSHFQYDLTFWSNFYCIVYIGSFTAQYPYPLHFCYFLPKFCFGKTFLAHAQSMCLIIDNVDQIWLIKAFHSPSNSNWFSNVYITGSQPTYKKNLLDQLKDR